MTDCWSVIAPSQRKYWVDTVSAWWSRIPEKSQIILYEISASCGIFTKSRRENLFTLFSPGLVKWHIYMSDKKLCYCRGTARRDCQYRKKHAIDERPWHTRNVITVAAIKWPYGISLPVWGLLFQRLYLGPFSRHYHLWSERDCLWPWELLHFWQRSLNYKPRALSKLCINIS